MKYNYLKIKSPIGFLHLVSNQKQLVAVVFDSSWKSFIKKQNYQVIEAQDALLTKTEKQLNEYFKNKRRSFDIPLALDGTEFQKKAWTCLQKIPYGKTISYQEQATKIKNPKAVRAIGGANGQNKICIIIPCHRVIGKNGSLTGFGGGIDIKKQLLQIENAIK